MIEDSLGGQLIGHISRDSTAIEARESIAKKDKAEVAPVKPKNKRGRPQKGQVHPTQEPSPLERQRSQTLEQMRFDLDTACATGTKKNAQGYKISWKGYKLHLDTACHELMDGAYQRYKTRSGAERCNARLKDEFGARHVQVRGHAKVMYHLMLGVMALCADQFTGLLV